MTSLELSVTEKAMIIGKTFVRKCALVAESTIEPQTLGEIVHSDYKTTKEKLPQDFDSTLMREYGFTYPLSMRMGNKARKLERESYITPGIFDPVFSQRISDFYNELYTLQLLYKKVTNVTNF